MNRRGWIIVGVSAALAVAAATGLIWGQRLPPEPSFEGKPATYWIDRILDGSMGDYSDTSVFRDMGMAAEPYVVAALRRRNGWRQSQGYAKLRAWLPRHLRAQLPGPRTLPPNDMRLPMQAAAALLQIGNCGRFLPSLAHDPNVLVRRTAFWLAGSGVWRGPLPAPMLFAGVKDSDAMVRQLAVAGSRSLDDTVIPLLITALDDNDGAGKGQRVPVRAEAARELGLRGERARAAVPKLEGLLQVRPRDTRMCALIALARIDHRHDRLAALINELDTLPPERLEIVSAIGVCGTAAAEAAPTLVKVWKAEAEAAGSSASDASFARLVRRAVVEALKRIAPDVAAREGIQ